LEIKDSKKHINYTCIALDGSYSKNNYFDSGRLWFRGAPISIFVRFRERLMPSVTAVHKLAH